MVDQIDHVVKGCVSHCNNGYNGYGNCGGRDGCLPDLVNSSTLSEGFRSTTDSVYKSGNDVIAAVHEAQTSLQGAISAAGHHGVEAARDEGGKTRQDISSLGRDTLQEFSNTRKEICDVAHGVSKELCNVRQEVGEVKHQVAVSTKEILLENQKAESRTREELLKGFHQTQLDACKNTDQLQRAIDNCCCETKELVREQASLTRELILSHEAKAKDVEIANLKLQIALLGNNAKLAA